MPENGSKPLKSTDDFTHVAGLWARRRVDAVMLTLLFITSITLHVATAARTITFSDAGDFLMAIKTVGNCHGPGYPLFIMSAKMFSWIFPVGSFAFRVSVFSGLLASLSGCLIYWAVYRMTRSRIGGTVAALAFLFSYTFWYETVIPGPYGMNIFFFAFLLVLVLRWERQIKTGLRKRADNTLALSAFVFGLAMTNHFSTLFLLPALLYFLLATDWRAVLNPGNILRMGAFFVLGLLPYLYEPTAAFRGPAYNYGDPSTLGRWFRAVTLYYDRGGLFSYPLKFLPARMGRYFVTLLTEFPLFFPLAVLGLVAGFLKKSKKYGIFLVIFFLMTSLTIMTYQQLESVLRAHFYYPSYLAVAIFIGFGAAWLARLTGRWASSRDRLVKVTSVAAVGLVLVVLTAIAIPVHYDKVNKSDYTYARDMALAMLKRAGPNGLILVDSDNVIFPLLYMQNVEGVATGVRVVSPHSLRVPGWATVADLGQQVVAPGSGIKKGDPAYLRITKLSYEHVPVFSTSLVFDFFGFNQQWEGMLLHIYPPGAPHGDVKPAVVRKGPQPLADIDSDARESIELSDIMRSYALLNDSRVAEAERRYERVARFASKDLYVPTLFSCEVFSNVYDLWGQVVNRQEDYRKTVREMPGAFEFNPNFASLAYARALSLTGSPSAALHQLNDYITVHPDSAAAYAGLAVIKLSLNDFRGAASALRTAVKLEPDNPETRYQLGVAYASLGDRRAIDQFKAAVEKGPGTQWPDLARKALDSLQPTKPQL